MGVQAVIFDWGGTLTPWHDLEPADMWRAICSAHLPPDTVEKAVAALCAAEDELWRRGAEEHRSATLAEAFAMAGVRPTEELLLTHFETWTPHTHTDPAFPMNSYSK